MSSLDGPNSLYLFTHWPYFNPKSLCSSTPEPLHRPLPLPERLSEPPSLSEFLLSFKLLSRPSSEPSLYPLGTVTGARALPASEVALICNYCHEPDPSGLLAVPLHGEGQAREQPPPILPWQSPETNMVLAHDRYSAWPCGELGKERSIDKRH